MVDSVGYNIQANEVQKVEAKQQYVTYRGRSKNDLERIPDSDSFESPKKKHTGAKIAIGAIIAAGLATAVDFIWFHGEHVKGIGKWFKNTFKIGEKAAQGAVENTAKATEENIARSTADTLVTKDSIVAKELNKRAEIVKQSADKQIENAINKESKVVESINKEPLSGENKKVVDEALNPDHHPTVKDVDAYQASLHEVRTPEQDAVLEKVNKEAAEATAEASQLQNNATLGEIKTNKGKYNATSKNAKAKDPNKPSKRELREARKADAEQARIEKEKQQAWAEHDAKLEQQKQKQIDELYSQRAKEKEALAKQTEAPKAESSRTKARKEQERIAKEQKEAFAKRQAELEEEAERLRVQREEDFQRMTDELDRQREEDIQRMLDEQRRQQEEFWRQQDEDLMNSAVYSSILDDTYGGFGGGLGGFGDGFGGFGGFGF